MNSEQQGLSLSWRILTGIFLPKWSEMAISNLLYGCAEVFNYSLIPFSLYYTTPNFYAPLLCTLSALNHPLVLKSTG